MGEQDADDAGSDGGPAAETGDGESKSATQRDDAEDLGADDSRVDIDDFATAPEGDADAALREVLEFADGDVEEALAELEVPTETIERVEAADAETIATELAALRTRIEALEGQLAAREDEVQDLESRLARKQADFQNYKKRQEERMDEEKRRATEDLVERLFDVRDNLALALDQDEDADIRGGVESTLRQLDAEFERENVERIEPEPGADVDPERHEVLLRVESDRPEGTVVEVHRPGYGMAGKVLRAAQVTTSDGGGDEGERDDGQKGDGGQKGNGGQEATGGDGPGGAGDGDDATAP